jgi:hypothetical protein
MAARQGGFRQRLASRRRTAGFHHQCALCRSDRRDHRSGRRTGDIASRTVRFIGNRRRADRGGLSPGAAVFPLLCALRRRTTRRRGVEGLRPGARASSKLSRSGSGKNSRRCCRPRTRAGRCCGCARPGVLSSTVLPETEKWGIDSIGRLIATEAALDWESDPMLRLMAMVPPDAERMRALAARLKMSRAETERLGKWAAAPVVSRRWRSRRLTGCCTAAARDPLSDRIRLSLASARSARRDRSVSAHRSGRSQPPSCARASGGHARCSRSAGADLIARGMTPGPMGSKWAQSFSTAISRSRSAVGRLSNFTSRLHRNEGRVCSTVRPTEPAPEVPTARRFRRIRPRIGRPHPFLDLLDDGRPDDGLAVGLHADDRWRGRRSPPRCQPACAIRNRERGIRNGRSSWLSSFSMPKTGNPPEPAHRPTGNHDSPKSVRTHPEVVACRKNTAAGGSKIRAAAAVSCCARSRPQSCAR